MLRQSGNAALSRSDIEEALARVLASAAFARSPRLSRFLGHVVQEALEGRSDRISGYSLGVDVFDRPADFDPAVDTIVRVQARRLRQSLVTYYAVEGAGDPVVIGLPTGGYAPEFRPGTDPAAAPVPPCPRRRPIVAILPFDDFSSGPVCGNMVNGLTEQLIATATRYSELSVISRTTMFRYRGSSVAELREALAADFVCEGSVQSSPSALRVTAQFIDARTDHHIWAETFDRDLTVAGLFEIQNDIAEGIAARIADRYGPVRCAIRRSEGPGTQSMEAFAALLSFHDNYASHTPERHLEARTAIERALGIDPGFAEAWAALAAIHLDEYRFGFNPCPRELPPLDRARDAALHAALLKPECAMAHQFLACAHFHGRDDAAFGIAAEEALRLNPGHADLLADLGTCYGFLGEIDTGLAMLDRAKALNPFHPAWYHSFTTLMAYLDGDLETALQETLRAYMPGFYWSHAKKAAILAGLGRDAEAREEIGLLLDVYPDFAAAFRSEAEKWRASELAIGALGAGLRAAGLPVRA